MEPAGQNLQHSAPQPPTLPQAWTELYRGIPRRVDDPFGFFTFYARVMIDAPADPILEDLSPEEREEIPPTDLKDYFNALRLEFRSLDTASIVGSYLKLHRALSDLQYFYDGVETDKHSTEIVIARARRALELPALLRDLVHKIRDSAPLENGLTLKQMWELQAAGHESKEQHTEGFLTLLDHPVNRFVKHLRESADDFETGSKDIDRTHPPIAEGLKRILKVCGAVEP